MTAVDNRVLASIHKIPDSRTWAIAEGDDGVHYFFMPTDIRRPFVFRALELGIRIQGEPYEHKGRPRLRDVVVVTNHMDTVSHGAVTT